MRGGTGPHGSGVVLVEAPQSAGFPLNLILYMPFRILTYSSNILKASFDRMASMLVQDDEFSLFAFPGHLGRYPVWPLVP